MHSYCIWKWGCEAKSCWSSPTNKSTFTADHDLVLQPARWLNSRGQGSVSFFLLLEKCNFRMMMHAHVHVPHCRAGDSSTVSLAILQASQKDQGLYSCCIKNSYGKVTTEFNLTTEGKPQRCRFQWKPLAPTSSECWFVLKAFSSLSSSSSQTTFKSPRC